MKKIIFFELKKVIKSTLFKVMTVGLTLFILAFYGLVYLNTEKNFERIVLGDENLVSNFQSIIQEIEDLIDFGRLNEGEIMAKKEEIKFLERMVKDAKARSEGYEQEDWTKVLDPTIEFDKQIVSEQEAFGSNNSASRSLFTLKSNLEQNKLLRERNIKPVFPIDYSITVYDIFDTAEDESISKNMAKRYSSDGLYFQYTLISLFFSVIGVSFFLFLFGDILTKEGFRDSGPIQLLYTQPVKRSKIIVGKMLMTVITTH